MADAKIIDKIDQLHDKESLLCEEVKDLLEELKGEEIEEDEDFDEDEIEEEDESDED
jgi:hypothetical protein